MDTTPAAAILQEMESSSEEIRDLAIQQKAILCSSHSMPQRKRFHFLCDLKRLDV